MTSLIEMKQAAQRVMQRSDHLASLSSTLPTLTRVYLSKEHAAANSIVGQWMHEAGMRVWQDAVGNICGRYEGLTDNSPAILLGSHLDTVVNAGKYDGMLGVLTALETVQYLHNNKKRLPIAIEIVGFADEEGTRFGVTLLGSKALTGEWQAEWLDVKDSEGISLLQALKKFGLNPNNIHTAKRHQKSILAYLEIHIEQGPCLEAQNIPLGVVTAINGARRLKCSFTGEAGHAGTVPMNHRKDALNGAAEWILAIESLTQANREQIVATVGYIENKPNAVNVISGHIELSLDIRGDNDLAIDQHLGELLEKAESIAKKRSLSFKHQEYYRIAATSCDLQLQERWIKAINTVQKEPCLSLPSGAGHDAIAIAKKWPVSMMFVRCEKGISHNPAEAIFEADVALAVEASIQMVLSWQ